MPEGVKHERRCARATRRRSGSLRCRQARCGCGPGWPAAPLLLGAGLRGRSTVRRVHSSRHTPSRPAGRTSGRSRQRPSQRLRPQGVPCVHRGSRRCGWDAPTPDSSVRLAAPFARPQSPCAARAATVGSGPSCGILLGPWQRTPSPAHAPCFRISRAAQLLHPGSAHVARVPLG